MEAENIDTRIVESVLEVLRQREVVTHEKRALTTFGAATGPALCEKCLSRASGTSRENALVVGEADECAKPSRCGFIDAMKDGLVKVLSFMRQFDRWT
jgi:hypothetical protein